MKKNLKSLLKEARSCRVCQAELPLGPRPILRAELTARILIIGQAPGTRVHHSGIPWNDPSGNRLRQWLKIDRELFYDSKKIAIIPMGLCYPGKGKSGDLAPRKECAPLWHGPLLKCLKDIKLTLLVGSYAQNYYLRGTSKLKLSERVREAESYLPYLPLPHPSPRNSLWLKKNPWFEENILPRIRKRLHRVL